ncbi:MAG: 30S ribosomal protein S14 [Halobacteriaceae archaeon]
MSDSETEPETQTEIATGENAAKRTGERHECRRCERKQGLVSKYDIWLCRQCFREIARSMGFKKYS